MGQFLQVLGSPASHLLSCLLPASASVLNCTSAPQHLASYSHLLEGARVSRLLGKTLMEPQEEDGVALNSFNMGSRFHV